MEYVICTAQSFWSDPEAKLLMEKFRDFKHEVGPMKTFKNKKSMWEKISADILSELGSLKTGAQCENRYKTVRKRKGWVDDQEDKAGNLDENGDSPLEKKKLLDDNRTSGISAMQPDNSDPLLPKSQEVPETIEVEVDVRRGVGQVSYSNAACESDHHDEDDKRDKKRFRQTLSTVLLQIHREKEEARERRHREKMELLKMLLQ